MNNNNYITEEETVKIKIEDWMLLSQEERQKHLNLITECQFHTYTKETKHKGTIKQIGDLYSNREQRVEAKRRLLYFHQIEDFNGNHIHTCHKCSNDSGKDKVCINPLHLAFGTVSENHMDIPDDIRKETIEKARNSMTVQQRYERNCNGGKIGGKNNGKNGTTGFQQKVECPHCNKIGNLINMKRYHFDNCKLKT